VVRLGDHHVPARGAHGGADVRRRDRRRGDHVAEALQLRAARLAAAGRRERGEEGGWWLVALHHRVFYGVSLLLVLIFFTALFRYVVFQLTADSFFAYLKEGCSFGKNGGNCFASCRR
jgi:hypothetical protein